MLLISGTLDGRTPPSRASHDDDLFLSTPQIKETMIRFMRGEKLPANIKTLTVPPFEFRKVQ